MENRIKLNQEDVVVFKVAYKNLQEYESKFSKLSFELKTLQNRIEDVKSEQNTLYNLIVDNTSIYESFINKLTEEYGPGHLDLDNFEYEINSD